MAHDAVFGEFVCGDRAAFQELRRISRPRIGPVDATGVDGVGGESTASPRRGSVVNERVVAGKLEQIEQYHGELVAKRTALSRTDYLESTTE